MLAPHDLLALFADDLELALAAYNAGENAVTRNDNTIPPFAETREYVKLVQQKQLRMVIPGRRSALLLSGDAAE